MPTYQYTCTECGEPLEAVQKFSDDPLTVCPACGGKLRKIFSPVGIVFKGSGFYRTDSRASASNGSKDNAHNAPSSDSSSSSEKSAGADQKTGSSGSGTSSGESKPAAKKDSSSSGKPTTGTKVA